MLQVRLEELGDCSGVRDLLIAAFGQTAEADFVAALRADHSALLLLVAEQGGRIVGHLAGSRITLETSLGDRTSVSLAPVAVDPAHQRQGIGAALIRAALDRLRQQGETSVFVLGEPAYYGRFGFDAALAATIACPWSGPYWQACELTPGALAGLAGTAVFPPPFDLFL